MPDMDKALSKASNIKPSTTLDFSKVQLIEIDPDQAGQRVDNFLLARLKGVPKSRLYRLLRKGEVRVNKKRIKPEYKLLGGDVLRVAPIRVAERAEQVRPGQGLVQALEKSILLETDALMVVNKPSGLAVHGGSGVTLGLIEALRQMRPDARYLELVHRLDRATSGCILIAKKRSMLRHLQSAFREKSLAASQGGVNRSGVNKVYQALVFGRWPKRRRRIDAPLLKSKQSTGEAIVRVSPSGKPSLTEFQVLQRYSDCTLVEAKPITGRTHQIRVHAQSIGHNLVGDDKYGDDDFNKLMHGRGFRRLFLHAAELSFRMPEGETVHVQAPLTQDLQDALALLEKIED